MKKSSTHLHFCRTKAGKSRPTAALYAESLESILPIFVYIAEQNLEGLASVMSKAQNLEDGFLLGLHKVLGNRPRTSVPERWGGIGCR